ncbi:hypothetical protein B0T18DRAFT_487738 [Schizothecium vesticola]|uniref:Uncharacterized protein n=1 Tax=Schizothecium vesticola TaxID=314040 RepID=A0AA40F2E3_9PEZI|nr:hypothetical protein B0T18DRAFT_487738 [Schizothecium vesticola]
MVNINIGSVDKIVTGVEKVIATSLDEMDETILPLLHQRLSYRLRGLSDDISLAENYIMDAEQQLANLIEISFSDLQLSDVCRLANMALDQTSFDGPLSTPPDRSPRRGSPSPLGHIPSPNPSTPTSQSGLAASTDITRPGADDTSPEIVQKAENVQARVFELKRHAVDRDPKMSLDLVSCPEFGSRGLDSEESILSNNQPRLDNNRLVSKKKGRKISRSTRKLSRSQSALTGTALPDSEPPILRKPKPRGQLSTEIFTASDALTPLFNTPLFNTPLSRQRPSPNLLAIAGMMVAVAELDRLSLMADASPQGLFAAKPPITPSNTPSGLPFPPPATPALPERSAHEAPGAAIVEKGEIPPTHSSPASTSVDFASFPAFVRTPSPTPRTEPAHVFLPLLPAPAKASEVGLGGHGVGEGASSATATSLMAGAEGVEDTHAAVGKPDTQVAANGREPRGGNLGCAECLAEAEGRAAVVGMDEGGSVGNKQERANTLPSIGELESLGSKVTMRHPWLMDLDMFLFFFYLPAIIYKRFIFDQPDVMGQSMHRSHTFQKRASPSQPHPSCLLVLIH